MVAAEDDTKVLVAVRCRPLSKAEYEESNGEEDVKVFDRRFVMTQLHPAKVDDPLRVNRIRDRKYQYDFAFDETTTQVFWVLLDGVLCARTDDVTTYSKTTYSKSAYF
jgi:hypothetical protein